MDDRVSKRPPQWPNTCPFCGQRRKILLAREGRVVLAKTCPICGKNMPKPRPMDTHGWLGTPSPGTKKPPP